MILKEATANNDMCWGNRGGMILEETTANNDMC